MTQQSGSKLFYINNIRILLITMIILLHVAITYGAAGSWYYHEQTDDLISGVLLTIYCAIIQSFALGFFFLISGYFTPGSYMRKGPRAYIKDRLIRLGIPLLVYFFVINPLMAYTLYVRLMGKVIPAENLFETGPLWFVEALLIFTVAFHVWRRYFPDKTNKFRAPQNMDLLKFALLLSAANFVVRIWWKIGDGFSNLQFAYFPGYISLFVLGVIAFQNKWFADFSSSVGIRWLKISGVSILFIPVIMFLGGATEDLAPFMGGPHWQSLALSTWEAFVGIGLIAGLLVIFRQRLNSQGKFLQVLSENTYTVYIIHAPIVVFFSYAIRDWHLYPLLKFGFAGTVELVLCFLISHFVIRKIPHAEKVLN
jgi:fucose 4-O-acetylase-like acetyltransferase